MSYSEIELQQLAYNFDRQFKQHAPIISLLSVKTPQYMHWMRDLLMTG